MPPRQSAIQEQGCNRKWGPRGLEWSVNGRYQSMVSAIPLQPYPFFFLFFSFLFWLPHVYHTSLSTHLSAHSFVLSSLCLLFFYGPQPLFIQLKTSEHPMVPPTLLSLHQPIPHSPSLIPLFFICTLTASPACNNKWMYLFFKKSYPTPARVCTLQYNLVGPMVHGVTWSFQVRVPL